MNTGTYRAYMEYAYMEYAYMEYAYMEYAYMEYAYMGCAGSFSKKDFSFYAVYPGTQEASYSSIDWNENLNLNENR